MLVAWEWNGRGGAVAMVVAVMVVVVVVIEWWVVHLMSTARLVAQRLFFLAAGGWVLRDLPLPAPEVTSFSWLGPACTASAWVKRGLACQPVNRSRPRQSNITVARARRQRLVAWRRAARTPTRLAPPPPCSPAPRKRLGGGMGLD